MRFNTQLSRWTFIFLFCAMLALPAKAAVNVYLKIDGAKQGPFKGEGPNQWIHIVSISHGVEAPRDAATGRAAGKRQHTPIKITKEFDAASPQLQRAVATEEVLKQVVIEFRRPNKGGKIEVYQTLSLTNALVSHIQKNGGHEEIELTYQKIEVTTPTGKRAGDDWE